MICVMKSLKFGRLEATDVTVCSGERRKIKEKKE